MSPTNTQPKTPPKPPSDQKTDSTPPDPEPNSSDRKKPKTIDERLGRAPLTKEELAQEQNVLDQWLLQALESEKE
jgi:hypothetical protein